MEAFKDHDLLIQQAREQAEHFELTLDYTRESIDQLNVHCMDMNDMYKKGLFKDKGENVAWNLAACFGTYLGDTLLQNGMADMGFSWERDEDEEPKLFFGSRSTFPINKVYKAIINGSEDSIDNYYDFTLNWATGKFDTMADTDVDCFVDYDNEDNIKGILNCVKGADEIDRSKCKYQVIASCGEDSTEWYIYPDDLDYCLENIIGWNMREATTEQMNTFSDYFESDGSGDPGGKALLEKQCERYSAVKLLYGIKINSDSEFSREDCRLIAEHLKPIDFSLDGESGEYTTGEINSLAYCDKLRKSILQLCKMVADSDMLDAKLTFELQEDDSNPEGKIATRFDNGTRVYIEEPYPGLTPEVLLEELREHAADDDITYAIAIANNKYEWRKKKMGVVPDIDEIEDISGWYKVLEQLVLQIAKDASFSNDKEDKEDKEALMKIIAPVLEEKGYKYENGFLFD